MDNVLVFGKAGQLLDQLYRSAGADGNPDDASLGHERVRGLHGAILAHGLAVRDDHHDGGCILAAVHELCLCLSQSDGGERRRRGPLECCLQHGDRHGVVREMLDPPDTAIFLQVGRSGGWTCTGALVVIIPSRWTTEELQSNPHHVIAFLQVRDQIRDQLLGLLPSFFAKAAAAIHEHDHVDLRGALQEHTLFDHINRTTFAVPDDLLALPLIAAPLGERIARGIPGFGIRAVVSPNRGIAKILVAALAARSDMVQGSLLVELGARLVVAIAELQPMIARGLGARARATSRMFDGPVAAVCAGPARLGAAAPIGPIRELALLVATLRVATLSLLGVLARRTIVLHFR
mmetsp:Transcript_157323/g.504673  ORF Transcript_157323/g.504673 Transcript_157323/m.504673 type:complete len:348 (-) Transcript_157323:710-1753(-)